MRRGRAAENRLEKRYCNVVGAPYEEHEVVDAASTKREASLGFKLHGDARHGACMFTGRTVGPGPNDSQRCEFDVDPSSELAPRADILDISEQARAPRDVLYCRPWRARELNDGH